MISVIGIVLSLVLLMWLAYRGWSVIIVAPILAILAVLITAVSTGEAHLLATYTEVFMASMGVYVKSYFPIFLLGAIFGKLMDASGSANSIAYFITNKLGKGRELWAVVLSCAVITYGGVSLFVAAFAIYPIGAALFRASNLPKRLLPPAIALGAFTFTMTALPGSPQIQNAIPMKFFGTTAFAAPVLGVIAAAIMLFGGMFWLTLQMRKAVAKGEGYGEHANEEFQAMEPEKLPSFLVAILPIVAVIVVNFVVSKYAFVNYDGTYLEKTYATQLGTVIGNWSLIISLIVGVALTIIFNTKRLTIKKNIWDGVQGSFLAIMNTASEVGYGNVIKTLVGFTIVSTAMLNLSKNPLIGEAIASSTLAGITGSASGGLSIALSTFAEQFMKEASTLGLSPEVLHRVAAVACGGLDTLPHNGAVITLLGITGMTHKESYLNIGMCTVVIPTIATVVIIILGSMGIV